jgi:signal transduction histidine kinase
VLCAPLVNQGRRIGVAYLENNLVEDAFTAERLEVLELLSAQAALSIQNAEAYATLEQKVVERTAQLSERNQDLSNALEQLKAAQEQLVMQEKLAALGTTTAGIAHEIKNPLNFINNFAQSAVDLTSELTDMIENNRDTLHEDVASELNEILPMLQQSVKKIDEHGRRANGILGQMLLHARGERSVREMVDFNQLIDQSIPLGIEAIQRRDAHFNVKIETDFDATIGHFKLAAQDFTRVVVNIITNSWYALHERRRSIGAKFTPTIHVRTRNLRDRVEMRIRDNGTGIAPNAVKRIFEPFFTTKPAGDGTGLGLSIVHDIVVRDHRGTIDADTKVGEYTEIVITLPQL